MNLTEMLAQMGIELQDTGESIFNAGTKTRAVTKAVGLMSRLMPKRNVLETTIVIDVTSESFTTPATASATAYINAADISATVDGGTLTIADRTPDVPRRLTMTLTDANASVTDLVVIVKGYDEKGKYIEERWVIQDLAAGTAIQGKKYFKYISEVEVEKIAGNGSSDTLSLGSGNAYDTYIFLANKPIDYHSESITNMTRNTDYTMDYVRGAIKFINGGSMAAGTAYSITYKLDPLLLDVSALIPEEDYLKVERVEYPVGEDTPTMVVFEPYGDTFYIKTKEGSFTEDNHLRLIYTQPWKMPGTNSEGDYPRHLDNAVIIGACGQALIFLAESYVQSAITNIAASKTLLDAISAVTTPTAPDISSYIADADTALDAAVTRFASAVTEAAKMDTPLANAATAAGKMAAEVAAGKSYLETGDDLITTIQDAERVAEKYAEYSQAQYLASQGYGKEVETEVAIAMAWEARAAREMAIGTGYVQEAVQRLASASRDLEKYQLQLTKAGHDVAYFNAQVAQSTQYQTTAAQYLDAAGRYLASGQAKINEFLTMLGIKAEGQWYKGSSEQFS